MPLKYLKDGQPIEGVTAILVHPDGKESEFDADRAIAKISELNAESKGWREKAQAFEKAIDGIDLAEAREAIAFKKSNPGKKGDAEEIQRLVKEQVTGYAADFDKKALGFQKEIGERDELIRHLTVSQLFGRSNYFVAQGEKAPAKTFLTPGKAEAAYGRFFHVENGKVVPKWPDGSPILSRKNFAEPAEFDEAIEAILEKDPEAKQLMRSTVADGGGAKGNPNSPNTGPQGTAAQRLAAGLATPRAA